jgi:hypothetical protein
LANPLPGLPISSPFLKRASSKLLKKFFASSSDSNDFSFLPSAVL